MHLDIAIYKAIAEDRLERVKNETYGQQIIEKRDIPNWKYSVILFIWNNF